MREASSVSPFAAQTRQERQARWLEWQQRSVEAVVAGHQAQENRNEQGDSELQELPVPYITHRRYDAVVQRMQNAKKQTGAYSAWS